MKTRGYDAALAAAWAQAANDLGIAVDIPFKTSAADGRSVIWPVRVAHFGGLNGTVVISGRTSPTNRKGYGDTAQSAQVRLSILSSNYEAYDRELFVGTLDDWGWSGPGEAPGWYTGRSWT